MTSQAMVETGHVTALSIADHMIKKMATYLRPIEIFHTFITHFLDLQEANSHKRFVIDFSTTYS